MAHRSGIMIELANAGKQSIRCTVRQDIAYNERISPVGRFCAVGLFEIFAAPAALLLCVTAIIKQKVMRFCPRIYWQCRAQYSAHFMAKHAEDGSMW